MHAPDFQPTSVEECSGELELIGVLRQAAADSSQPIESILDAVADAARVLSGADGTALALQANGVFVCRARRGSIAPELGAPMNSQSGISGECIRTATMLVCHDAFSDARVDGEVCRALGVRSVAAVPVRAGVSVVGILEAFSASPNAFDGDALGFLRVLADIATTAYRRQQSAQAAAAKPAPAVAVPSAPVPPPATVQVAAKSSAAPLVATEVLEVTGPGKHRIWIVSSIGLGLVLIIGVAWWSWHLPADESTGDQQVVRAASPDQGSVTTPTPVVAVAPKPGPGIVGRHSDAHRDASIVNAAEVDPVETNPEPKKSATIKGGSLPKAAATEPDSPVQPPTVILANNVNADELSRLTSVSTQIPVGPRVSQGVVEPRIIHKVDPIYPNQARSQHLSGKVTMSATITTDGVVRQVELLKGSPILAEAAKTAVKQWKYHPAMLNGNPVEIQQEITFVFNNP